MHISDALKRAVHLGLIYRLGGKKKDGVNKSLNSSPHGVGSIVRLINHKRKTNFLNHRDREFLEIKISLGKKSRKKSKEQYGFLIICNQQKLIFEVSSDSSFSLSLILLAHKASTAA